MFERKVYLGVTCDYADHPRSTAPPRCIILGHPPALACEMTLNRSGSSPGVTRVGVGKVDVA